MYVLQSVTTFSNQVPIQKSSQANKTKSPIWITWERDRTFNGELGITPVCIESPVKSD